MLKPAYFRDIEVWVIGGAVSDSIHETAPNLSLFSFAEIISDARAQLEWLLGNLQTIQPL